jgi:hypothetical protein
VSDGDGYGVGRLGGRDVAGVGMLELPFSAPGFRNAVLADPQGAAFSISQLVLGPA